MAKTLECDELDFLSDLPLFKSKVASKIYEDEYTVKESYQEISKEKEDDRIVLKIHEDKCYDDRITKFTIKLVPETNVILSYKADGPAVFNYAKPFTNSTRSIMNRESGGTGYKISTGEIMNCTKVWNNLIFSKTEDGKLLYMTREFFKGGEKDSNNPPLNTLTNIAFDYDENDIIMNGTLQETMYDKDGNIEEYFKADTKYADVDSGEMICVDIDYNYISADSIKRNIIPTLADCDLEKGKVVVEFVRKEDTKKVLSTETFEINEDGNLVPVKLESGFGTINIDRESGKYICISEVDGKKYSIVGSTNFPLSGDIFTFSEFKGSTSMSMNSYFDNIYEAQYGGEVFLTKNDIYSVDIDQTYFYHYYYDDYGIIKTQAFKAQNTEWIEMGSYGESTLPNGNKIIESVVLAEPVYPINKKSIFYRAVEIDKDGEIASDYRALIIKHKSYNEVNI